MEYCITMERTLRTAISFEADNDDQACKKAEEISAQASSSDYEPGEEERDYALCDEAGRLIVDWK